MIRYSTRNYIWWLHPSDLTGMPMPFIDPTRRKNPTSPLGAFDDDIPVLHAASIKTVVSLVKGYLREPRNPIRLYSHRGRQATVRRAGPAVCGLPSCEPASLRRTL
jgi:hypothetical protein